MVRGEGARRLVGLAAMVSVVLAFVVPGSIAYAAGMSGFLLLPLLLASNVGARKVKRGIVFGTGRNREQFLDLFSRGLGTAAFASFAFLSTSLEGMGLGALAVLVGNACAFLALDGLTVALFSPPLYDDAVTIEGETLTIHDGANGTKVVSYAELKKVEVDQERVVLSTSTDSHLINVAGGVKSAARLARLILDAKEKAASAAQDDGPMRELRRGTGMTTREWLGRIDAAAAASRSPGAYRGVGLDEEQLWSVLANEEERIDARSAAARVLASSEDPALRVRVATSVKAIADDFARVRVELATKADTDAAAAELDALEMEELRTGVAPR